jgi:hypothetical protein
MQAGPRVLQRIDAVHRRSVGRGQPGRLRVIKAAPDIARRDLLHVVGIDEAQAVPGRDHDPVEDIDFRHFQHMLKGADLGSRGRQDRGPAGCRLIGDRHLVGHAGPRLATR